MTFDSNDSELGPEPASAALGWWVGLLMAASLALPGCKPADEPQYPWGPPPATYPGPGGEALVAAAVPAEPPALELTGETEPEPTDSEPAESEPTESEPTESEPTESETPDDGTGGGETGGAPSNPAESADDPPPIPVPEARVEPSSPDPESNTGESNTGEPNTGEPDTGESETGEAGEEAGDELENAAGADPEAGGETGGARAGGEAVVAPAAGATGLPQLTPAQRTELFRKPSRREEREANRRNRDGLRHHKAGRYEHAIEEYREALESDPSARYPRYNLACAYALTGEADLALFHLVALRELGHRDKVADARTDSDFTRLRSDARFRRLTGYAVVRIIRAEGVARDVSRGLERAIARQLHYVADDAGTSAVSRTRVLRRAGFEAAADRIADLLVDAEVGPMGADLRAKHDAADVLVFVAREKDVVGGAERLVQAQLDVVLRGRSRLGTHELKLKSSGFFTETIVRPGLAGTIKRSGTWRTDGDELVRSYKETRESEERIEEPVELDDRLDVGPHRRGLVLDTITFTR